LTQCIKGLISHQQSEVSHWYEVWEKSAEVKKLYCLQFAAFSGSSRRFYETFIIIIFFDSV